MTLTAEQLAQRRKGLTATDMTKLTGLSKYGGAIDVLMDKRGIEAPFEDTDRVKWGNILEDPIRQDYAERHQVHMRVPGTLTHPKQPWAMATPDGIVWEPEVALKNGEPDWGWECKTHTSWLSHLYGEPGSDEVPAWELVQCAWNLYVARAYYGVDMTRWDLTAFVDGVPTDYTIHRDPELEGMLVETGQTFWQEHVRGGKPLDPDGSESYSKELARRWPKHGGDLRPANEITLKAVRALRATRDEIKAQKVLEETFVQQIKTSIGADVGLTFPGDDGLEAITWKRTKDSERVDWVAAYKELRDSIARWGSYFHSHQIELPSLDGPIKNNTSTKDGSRRFCVPRSWSK